MGTTEFDLVSEYRLQLERFSCLFRCLQGPDLVLLLFMTSNSPTLPIRDPHKNRFIVWTCKVDDSRNHVPPSADMNSLLGAQRCLRCMSDVRTDELKTRRHINTSPWWAGGQDLTGRSAATIRCTATEGKTWNAHFWWCSYFLTLRALSRVHGSVVPSRTRAEFPSSPFCFFNVPHIVSYIRMSFILPLTWQIFCQLIPCKFGVCSSCEEMKPWCCDSVREE